MKKKFISGLLVLSIVLTELGFVASTTEAAAMKLNKKKLVLKVGKSYKLKVKNAKGKKIKWTTSNKKVAKVTKKGKVTAKKKGKAIIRAIIGKKKLKCTVTVRPKDKIVTTTPPVTVEPNNNNNPIVTTLPSDNNTVTDIITDGNVDSATYEKVKSAFGNIIGTMRAEGIIGSNDACVKIEGTDIKVDITSDNATSDLVLSKDGNTGEYTLALDRDFTWLDGLATVVNGKDTAKYNKGMLIALLSVVSEQPQTLFDTIDLTYHSSFSLSTTEWTPVGDCYMLDGADSIPNAFSYKITKNIMQPETTKNPTEAPTETPTEAPTKAPTATPTKAPTEAPTKAPTKAPTATPTKAPTEAPTKAPTKAPTEAPTKVPTEAPTKAPTEAPPADIENIPSAPYTLIFNNQTVKVQGNASYVVNSDNTLTISVAQQYSGIGFVLPDSVIADNFDTVTIRYKNPVNVAGGFGCSLWEDSNDKNTETVIEWGGVFASGTSGEFVLSLAGKNSENTKKATYCLFFNNADSLSDSNQAQVIIESVTFSHSEYDETDIPVPTNAPTEKPAPTAVPTEVPVPTDEPVATSAPETTQNPELKVDISAANEYSNVACDNVVYSNGAVSFRAKSDYGGGGVSYWPAGKGNGLDLWDYDKIRIEISSTSSNVPLQLGLYKNNPADIWNNSMTMGNSWAQTSQTAGEKTVIEYNLDYVEGSDREGIAYGFGVRIRGWESSNSYNLTVHSITFVPSEPVPELVSLKSIVTPVFGEIGTCINYSQLKQLRTIKYVQEHYTSISLENEMKPDAILGNGTLISVTEAKNDTSKYVIPDSYKESNVPKLNFDTIDGVLRLAKEYGLKLRAHTLVWHSQTPEFFFREGYNRNGAYVSEETMNARLEMYIRSVMHHVYSLDNGAYKDIVYTWDVANEYMHNNEYDPDNGKTDGNWSAVYGNRATKLKNKPGYIKYAFQIAYECLEEFDLDGKVTLIYNDFNTYYDCRDNIIEMINYINAEKKICDGVGMQSHVGVSFPSVSSYLYTVEAFIDAGFEVQITELDVGLSPTDASQTFELQAQYVSEMMTGLIDIQERKGGITGITWWGLCDQVSWRGGYSSDGNSHPLLFDKTMYDTKPAYYSFINAFK